MSSEKAALIIAFDEIEKSRQRIDAFAESATLAIREATNGLPELKQVVVEIQSKRQARQIVLAKGKSHIDKDGHLILVYTDGTKEDVGEVVKPTMLIRHHGGGGSGLDRQQVIQIIEETVATSPLIGYRISDEDSDAAVKYYGYIATDGAWYIMRVTDTVEIAEYRYTKGTTGYAAGWTGRAALAYVLLSELGL